MARRIVRDNGLADRVEFIEDDALRVTLPERVDVIVADVRGVLPIGLGGIRLLMDARARFLRPGGVIIPLRERIVAAIGHAPHTYASLVEPWDSRPAGFDMSAASRLAVNALTAVRGDVERLLSDPVPWIDIDYARVTSESVGDTIEFTCSEAGVAHGIMLWFESTLVEGVTFSSPGQGSVYGRALLSWPEPVDCERGTRIAVSIRSDVVGGERLWTWKSEVDAPGGRRRFNQSTLSGPGFSPARLRRRAAAFAPSWTIDAEMTSVVLDGIRDGLTLGAIAGHLRDRFGEALPDDAAALEFAADVAERCGR